MRNSERRRELLEWLEQAGNLTLSEMVERFGVSKMTVHRDLEMLEQRKALKRIHGGAVAIGARSASGAGPAAEGVSEDCLICSRPSTSHLQFSLTLESGTQKLACCPHCGVYACLVLGEQVEEAHTSDYLTGRSHPVSESFFVLGSAAIPCCQPSMLTFDSEEMAQRFQAGFGGVLGGFEFAVNFLKNSMAPHSHQAQGCPHCTGRTLEGKKQE